MLPQGPNKGENWRRHFQPFAYWILHLMDSLGFRKYRIVGCVQSGKTFTCDIITALWHLFDREESVVFGIPQMENAEQVWIQKFKPVFDASPWLKHFLPKKGGGSKGGFSELIEFTNGTFLTFMGGLGGDGRRSGVTADVAIKTEVDRYDTPTESSRETSAPEQMDARTESLDDQGFSYEECTVTEEDGRIWTEVNEGTFTHLWKQCVGCRQPVFPDRDDLVGIDDAPDVIAAGENGRFRCRHCGMLWGESERRQMNRWDGLIPVHRGQQAILSSDGAALLEGDLPRTDKFSIRWNAFDNMFWKIKSIAMAEWRALYSKKPEEMDVKREQFAWARPRKPRVSMIVPLTMADIYNRATQNGKGIVPPFTKWLSRGVDLRGPELHFVLRAWCTEDENKWWAPMVDLGIIPIRVRELGQSEAIIEALSTLRDQKKIYYSTEGKPYPVNFTLVDRSWMKDVVMAFMLDCRERGEPGWMAFMGRGQSEPPGKGSYVEPKKVDPVKGPVVWKGEQCHVSIDPELDLEYCTGNSDHWKSFVRNGYAMPPDQNGALVGFASTTADEKKLQREHAKQLLVERMIRRRVAGRGLVDCWFNDSDAHNHYGDCDYEQAVGANILGVRVVTRERPTPPSTETTSLPRITMPSGAPFHSNTYQEA